MSNRLFNRINCSRFLYLLFVLLTIVVTSTSGEELSKEKSKSTLKHVVAVIRHGTRYQETKRFANENELKHLGELTPLGTRQMYELGLAMKDLYSVQEKFLSVDYNPSEMYVRSTDRNRTIQSAQSFLAGFYPIDSGSVGSDVPEEYLKAPFSTENDSYDAQVEGSRPIPTEQTAIPVRTIPEYLDRSLSQIGKSCAKYSQFIHTNSDSSEAADLSELFYDEVTRLGEIVSEFQDPSRDRSLRLNNFEVYLWYDGVLCRKMGGASTSTADFDRVRHLFFNVETGEDTDLMRQLHDFNEINSFVVFLRDKRSVQLGGSQFFDDLLNMYARREKDRNAVSEYKTKFIGLFAHDITIKTILRVLQMSSWQCKRLNKLIEKKLSTAEDTFSGDDHIYANRCILDTTKVGENLILELRESNDEAKTLFVSIRFNGEYIPFACQRIGKDFVYKEECSLQEFRKFVNDSIEHDLDTACAVKSDDKITDQKAHDSDKATTLAEFIIILILIIAIASLWYNYVQYKSIHRSQEQNQNDNQEQLLQNQNSHEMQHIAQRNEP